jgi:uncharacterized protein (TIRG00374 family)
LGVGLLFSAVFAALLFRGVNGGELLQHVLAVNPLWIVPAAVPYFGGVWLRALRWRWLLSTFADVPATRLYSVELIGFGINNVMPLRIGEVLRAWLLARSHGVRPAATLGSIVVERVLDGIFLCLLLVVGLLGLTLEEWLRQAAFLAAAAFGIATLGIVIAAFAPGLVERVARNTVRLAPEHSREMLLSHGLAFLGAFAALGRGAVLPLVLLLTVACWLTEGVIYWLMLVALGIPADADASLLGMAAANLATIIPSSPGYVGTFHLPLQSILVSGYHVPAAEAAAYAIVTHAVIVLPVAILGVVLLAREGLSLHAVRERASSLRREIRGLASDRSQA